MTSEVYFNIYSFSLFADLKFTLSSSMFFKFLKAIVVTFVRIRAGINLFSMCMLKKYISFKIDIAGKKLSYQEKMLEFQILKEWTS